MCEKENLEPMQIGAKEITYKAKRTRDLVNEASTKTSSGNSQTPAKFTLVSSSAIAK